MAAAKLYRSIGIRSSMERDREKSEIRFEPLQVQAIRFVGRGVAALARWILGGSSAPNPRA